MRMSPATAAAHRGRDASSKPSAAPARCSSSVAGPWRLARACCSGVWPHLLRVQGLRVALIRAQVHEHMRARAIPRCLLSRRSCEEVAAGSGGACRHVPQGSSQRPNPVC
jgi:hypothetical protein